MIISRRPRAVFAVIVLWMAAPTVVAVCGVPCQTVNLRACCQHHSTPMPNMPMPNAPASHRHITNTPMPGLCSAGGFEAAFCFTTITPENRSAAPFARTAAAGVSRAISALHSASEVINFARLANRGAPAPAISGVPLRI